MGQVILGLLGTVASAGAEAVGNVKEKELDAILDGNSDLFKTAQVPMYVLGGMFAVAIVVAGLRGKR